MSFLRLVTTLLLAIAATFFVSPEGTRKKNFAIEIRMSQCKLDLYEIYPGSTRTFVKSYAVATAKRALKPVPMGKGVVTKIVFNPWWFPTAYTCRYFKENLGIDLPAKVPPGDPLNFLGTVNIHLSHSTWKGDIYRIHGNNDESLIGQRVTGGCIRMRNKDAEELARIIGIGTEVNIVP